jgi:oligopeptide/dipeptide ABC transporter ATP-binding protein
LEHVLSKHLLEIENLTVRYVTSRGLLYALNNINFTLEQGETIGLVGESGSGKSTLLYTLLGLLPGNASASGRIIFDGEKFDASHPQELRGVRGRRITTVFQDPMSSLNPLLKTYDQIADVIATHDKEIKDERKRAMELLRLVRMPDPERVLNSYPYELSGGMQQRVMIAMALSTSPRLMLADEPTTAVDATVQTQLLELLRKLQEDFELAIIVVTHNMDVISDICSKVGVMYAGNLIELGPIEEVVNHPQHPYTVDLLAAVPQVHVEGELRSIPGSLPDLVAPPTGCMYHPRCSAVMDRCRSETPGFLEISTTRKVACHLYGK